MATHTQMEVTRASARVANCTRHFGPDDPKTIALRGEWHLAKALNHVDQMREHLRALTPDQRSQVFAALSKDW